MTKRPSFQFYPADWRKDAALQSCSIAARGLWLECMNLMHECEPYGHLVVNGRPMTAPQIGRLVGVSAKESTALLKELHDAGVLSMTEECIIYSRRMVRDEEIRNARAKGGEEGSGHGIKGAEHGAKGGRPRKQTGVEKPPLYPPPSSSSSSSSSEGSSSAAVAFPRERLLALCEALHVNPATHAKVLVDFPKQLQQLENEGLNFEKHILPAAQEVGARGKPISSLAYLRRRAEELRAAEILKPPPKPAVDSDWRARMRVFAGLAPESERGDWDVSWGPKPGEHACLVPTKILCEFDVSPVTEAA